MRDRNLDQVARSFASGEISRRTALRRLAGGALAAAVPGALLAGSASAACPDERKCDGRCCPKNSRCRRGKCKCKRGFTKCGKKCVKLSTSKGNCGACGNACAEGEFCEAGVCVNPCPCTGFGGGCGPGEYCDIPPGNCAACGTCAPRPSACTFGGSSDVCGCDGLTYGNQCQANQSGVSVQGGGACPQ